MRLAQKTAIITGAGAGIGEAIAIRFAEEGAALVLNDLYAEAAERTRAKLPSGSRAVVAAGNVAEEATGPRLAQAALDEFGSIDILVNNAADFTQKNIEAASVGDWERVLNVNVVAVALVSKAVVPHMKARGGSIVNMASQSGIIAQRNFATYNASKGAVITLTRCMALDLAPHRIRVNSICPGTILTSASYREIERLGLTFETWRDQVAPQHMLNRLGEPREVANATLFLASDEASFMTAAELLVDGGATAW